jgi:hypothetical protein
MQNDSPGLEHGFKIGGKYGYRIEGDTASLNADLAIVDGDEHRTAWALQLWACEQPYEGGLLRGTKVAEVLVALPSAPTGPTLPLEAETFANIPPSRREYCMVLVLASGEPGTFEQVHDFANYPKRELFAVPYLDGSIGYSIEGDSVILRADRVHNPRHAGSLSGSLALELWALSEPYAGGALDGLALARGDIGQIGGQCTLEPLQVCVPLSPPPPGQWQLALVLREWTAAGFVNRDCCNFAVPFSDANGAPARTTAPLVMPHDAGAEHRSQGGVQQAPPSHDEIAVAAYLRHLGRGWAAGSAIDDWLEAERELLRSRADVSPAPAPPSRGHIKA